MNYHRQFDRRHLKSLFTGLLLVGCGGLFLFLLLGLVTNDTAALELDRMATMRSVRPKGIQNSGNTCFAASVVQMLFRIGFLRESLLALNPTSIEHLSEERKRPILGLQNLFHSLNDPNVKTVKDHKGRFIPAQFSVGQAADAEEFFLACLDLFGSVLEVEKLQAGLSLQVAPSDHLERMDFWSSIRVTFPEIITAQHTALSLDSLLTRPMGPFGEEIINGKPQIYRIIKAPQVLVLSFVRSLYNPKKGTLLKIKTPVNIPESLDITPYYTPGSINNNNNNNNNTFSTSFHLKMFILHTGNPGGGHYVAYIKETESLWNLIDDEKIKSLARDEALEAAKQSSICFYERYG